MGGGSGSLPTPPPAGEPLPKVGGDRRACSSQQPREGEGGVPSASSASSALSSRGKDKGRMSGRNSQSRQNVSPSERSSRRRQLLPGDSEQFRLFLLFYIKKIFNHRLHSVFFLSVSGVRDAPGTSGTRLTPAVGVTDCIPCAVLTSTATL